MLCWTLCFCVNCFPQIQEFSHFLTDEWYFLKCSVWYSSVNLYHSSKIKFYQRWDGPSKCSFYAKVIFTKAQCTTLIFSTASWMCLKRACCHYYNTLNKIITQLYTFLWSFFNFIFFTLCLWRTFFLSISSAQRNVANRQFEWSKK